MTHSVAVLLLECALPASFVWLLMCKPEWVGPAGEWSLHSGISSRKAITLAEDVGRVWKGERKQRVLPGGWVGGSGEEVVLW